MADNVPDPSESSSPLKVVEDFFGGEGAKRFQSRLRGMNSTEERIAMDSIASALQTVQYLSQLAESRQINFRGSDTPPISDRLSQTTVSFFDKLFDGEVRKRTPLTIDPMRVATIALFRHVYNGPPQALDDAQLITYKAEGRTVNEMLVLEKSKGNQLYHQALENRSSFIRKRIIGAYSLESRLECLRHFGLLHERYAAEQDSGDFVVKPEDVAEIFVKPEIMPKPQTRATKPLAVRAMYRDGPYKGTR